MKTSPPIPHATPGTGIPLALLCLLSLASGLSGGIISYTHDAAGRLTGANYGSGRSITYAYNDAGNLTQKSVTVSSADSDNDGMDDAWELQFFGNLSRDGTGDFDGDGFRDLHEFLAGTGPGDPNSALRILPNPAVSGGGVTVQWQSVPGKTYRLQFKNSLTDATWQNVAGDVTAVGVTAIKIDPTSPGQPRRLYRVMLVP